MPHKYDHTIFPHLLYLPINVDGSLEFDWKTSPERQSFDLQSAFKQCLRESKIPVLEATHTFFYSFALRAIASLQNTLNWAFLNFDHDNDEGPTFDEKYLNTVRKIQSNLVSNIQQVFQHESQVPANHHILRNLLEESGVNSLLLSDTPEAILARANDERNLAERRRVYKYVGLTSDFKDLENFELLIAKYQIHQRGLKVGNNQELLSTLLDEIRQRTSSYNTQNFGDIQEQGPSGQIESETIDRTESSHVKSRKKRAKRTEPGRIWKHLTISRDETSASEFLHERIILLFLKRNLVKHAQIEARNNSIGRTEDSETSAREQQTHSDPICSRTDAGATQPLFHQTFSGPTSFGMQSRHWFDPIFQDQAMNATDNETLTAGIDEDRSNSVISTPESDGFRCRQLASRLKSLELENQRLKENGATYENWKIIHFITISPGQESSGYFDKPVLAPGLKHDDITLRAFLPITDVGSYVKQTGLDFVVSRFYSASSLHGEVRSALAKKQPPPQPRPYREHIQLQSQQMIEALQEFLSLQPGFWDRFPAFDAREPIDAPYTFWYTYRSTDALQRLQPLHKDLMHIMTSWIEENYAKKYDEAWSNLDRGVVTLRTMPFLMCPGDVLIWKEKTKMKAAIASSLLKQTSTPILYWDSSQSMWSDDNTRDGTKKGEFSTTWTVEAWNFKFIGEFFRKAEPIEIKFKASSLEQEVEITKLAVYPLRFADEETKVQLETRGRTFWSCRTRNLVSHTGEDGIFANGERFMVDFQIYKELHSDSFKFQLLYGDEDDDEDNDDSDRRKMSSEEMESETPPPSPDIYVFPDTVPGYNLRSKKWVDLEVDRITDVKWNKKSFDNLVIDAKAKEMIQALVSHQIESEKGTDLIHRKGNGLIILLHGGPGTGKTFTAESVAEIAQKPLFCVTCGDIGTKPEEVEKYLESVLYLGKTWGCVVLIDEAEVFLEQRSLDNLERNALVSVFLRVLEYYEGILILTTNRVGTFDEAFKSRILLSLHYEKLSIGQRRKIWRGFINHLEDTHAPSGEKHTGREHKSHSGSSSSAATGSSRVEPEAELPEIDYQEILDSLDELASHELNGRQIRNIITTARQLAKFRKKTLDYGLLQEVISVSGKFDEYFSKLNENQSDEQIARSDGLR